VSLASELLLAGLGIILLVIVVVALSARKQSYTDEQFVLKYRGNRLKHTQIGGSLGAIPILETVAVLDLQPQNIKFQKHIIIDNQQNTQEVSGNLQFTMKNHPETFLDMIDSGPASDLTYLITAVMKQKIFKIISTDLWGKTRIDLMKNETRILSRLKDNILYNLELTNDDIDEFNLQFLLN